MSNITARRGRPRRLFPQENAAVAHDAPVEAMDEAQEAPVSRPSLRQAMREDDPRAAAARRAAEIMGHIGTVDEGSDEFYVNRSLVPDGWDIEWKTRTVLGAEDPAQMVSYQRMGWEPVPTNMFPEMMPKGWKGDTIERKGMIMMMRPKQITDMVRAADAKRARDQIRAKEAQLSAAPEGQFARDHAQVKPNIKKGYEPMPIPE
jgi:hypothetical protein